VSLTKAVLSLLAIGAVTISSDLAVARGGGSGGLRGTGSNSSSHSVRGYLTKHGTYVAPYNATNPNRTQLDNYGTRGNSNPYNGALGTRAPR